jgi:polyisoprenoid-binding protein YceI
MRRFILAAVAAVALVAPVLAQTPAPAAQPPAGPNTWTIDTAHSAAGFSVKHLLVSTVRGTLGPIKGTIDYDGKSLDSLKVDVTIDVTGINTGTEGRDKDLKSPNFFDVAQFPTATFKSKRAVADGAGKFKLTGDLTMHGVTKELTLNVEGPSAPLKQGANLRVGALATATINRRDWGLQYSRMVEATPAVSDEVHITIDLEATKRAPATPPQQ